MEPQLKRIQTSQLDLAYLEVGDPKGKPVVLLHGWPDDPTTWNEVSAELTNRGCHAFIPYLRGFGPTRFLASASSKSGQLAALGQDMVELTERLGLVPAPMGPRRGRPQGSGARGEDGTVPPDPGSDHSDSGNRG